MYYTHLKFQRFTNRQKHVVQGQYVISTIMNLDFNTDFELFMQLIFSSLDLRSIKDLLSLVLF